MSRGEILKSVMEFLVIFCTIVWQNSGLKNKLQQEIVKNRKTIRETTSQTSTESSQELESSLKRYLDTQFVTLQRHYNNRLQEQFDLIADVLKKEEGKDEEHGN